MHIIVMVREYDLSLDIDNKKLIISTPTEFPCGDNDVENTIRDMSSCIEPWIMEHDWKVVYHYDKNAFPPSEGEDTGCSGDPNIGEIIWMEKRYKGV